MYGDEPFIQTQHNATYRIADDKERTFHICLPAFAHIIYNGLPPIAIVRILIYFVNILLCFFCCSLVVLLPFVTTVVSSVSSLVVVVVVVVGCAAAFAAIFEKE